MGEYSNDTIPLKDESAKIKTINLITQSGWESYVIPSRPEYAKSPPQTGGSSHYFFIEKLPKSDFFKIKPLTRYNSKTFCEK
jgi:hypothetical protein